MTTATADYVVSVQSGAADGLALAGRILIAAIFVLSGIAKLSDPAGTAAYVASVGLPAPALAAWGAALLELVGGIALVVGFRTRLVAIALAAFSVVAAVIFHSALGDQNQFIHFFKNVAMAGGLLQVAAFGPGRFALTR